MKEYPFEFPVKVQKFWTEKSEKEKEEKWFVEGYAAVEGEDDSEPPMYLTAEALRNAERSLDTRDKLLYGHNPEILVGRVVEHKFLDEQPAKIWIKALISQTRKDIWQQIKEGILDGFSLGGSIKKVVQEYSEKIKRWVTKILDFTFREVSLVALPANVKCKVVSWYMNKALENYDEEGGEPNMGEIVKKEVDETKPEENEVKTETDETKNEEKTEEVKTNQEVKEETKDETKQDEIQKDENTEKAKDKDKYPDVKKVSAELKKIINILQGLIAELEEGKDGDYGYGEKKEVSDDEEQSNVEKALEEIQKNIVTKKDIEETITQVLSKIPGNEKKKLVNSEEIDKEEFQKEWNSLPLEQRLRLKLKKQIESK